MEEPTFTVTAERVSEDQVVVAVSGEVDLYNVPELGETLLSAIADGAKWLIVDLSDTTFIDSTTLGILVQSHKRVCVIGGALSIVCNDPTIRRIFEITGLDKAFSIHPSRAEALSELEPLAG